MSGGYFDYDQYKIDGIISSIEDYVFGKDLFDEYDADEYIKYNTWLSKEEAEWVRKHKRTLPNINEYSEETIAILKEGIQKLKEAETYAHRIDWLLSGDDGEEDFKERLKKDLEKLKTENNDTIRSITK